MKIAICASFRFYKHVVQVADSLAALEHTPLIPETAKRMQTTGDYRTDPLRDSSSEFSNNDLKTQAMRQHFDTIATADAILVVNDEKHNQLNYIGPNVLMEMAVAFAQGKPTYLLNDIPAESPLLDEIRGLQPIVLLGNLHGIV